MNIEALNPALSTERLREITIPPEATHEEQLVDILNSLSAHNYAILVGPSRAGKTTFLGDSLLPTLQENGYEDPLFLDCMTALPREVVSGLLTHRSLVALDEVTRMADNPDFLHSLNERIAAKYPTVICATLFDSKAGKAQLSALFTQLPVGEDATDVMVDFPVTMSQKDASRLIENTFPDASNAFISELTELTTQPYLLRLILDKVRKNGQANLSSSVQDLLQNSSINQSLKPEARSIWQKITSDPIPPWLTTQSQDDEESP